MTNNVLNLSRDLDSGSVCEYHWRLGRSQNTKKDVEIRSYRVAQFSVLRSIRSA